MSVSPVRAPAPRGRPRASLSLAEARRVALAAQGFARPRPAGPVNAGHLRRTLRALELVQIDSVNIVAPPQYLVPFSRLGPYDRAILDRLVHGRHEFTEHWAHEASILPVETWPLLRHRMHREDGRAHWVDGFMVTHRGYVARVLEAIRERGPVTAGEIPEPDGSRARTQGWWGWTTAKAALEGLLARGTLAVAGRRAAGSARLYDLAERVIPDAHRERHVPAGEARRELLLRSARALGVGTARDVADYFRLPITESRRDLRDLAAEGALRPVQVEGWREPAYLHPEARMPRRVDARALLSPFDPVVWYRPRAERLFGFTYRIEIYVPEAKRRWGYYVLPFLCGDRLVARVDLKADRSEGVLRVLAAHGEEGVAPAAFVPDLARELQTLAGWLGLAAAVPGRRGNLSRDLRLALGSGPASRRGAAGEENLLTGI